MRRGTLTLSTLTAVSFLLMSIATGTSAQSFSTDALVQAPTDSWRTNGGDLGSLTPVQIRDLAEYITQVLFSR